MVRFPSAMTRRWYTWLTLGDGDLVCDAAPVRPNAEGVESSSPGLHRVNGATQGSGCEHQPRRGLNQLRATP